jgi:glycosyltransferase involved in cell wall biosynthesis
MHIQSGKGCLHLCVLLQNDEIPQWAGELLLALDQLDGVALQLRCLDVVQTPSHLSLVSRWWRTRIPTLATWSPDSTASQRLAQWRAATGACDVTLLLDAETNTSPPILDTGDDATMQWAVTDHEAKALCRQFPLLDSICSGAGIPLQLLQRNPLTGLWHPIRKLHLASTPAYDIGLNALSPAVLQLVKQASVDWRWSRHWEPVRLDGQILAGNTGADAAPHPALIPWRQGLRGFVRSFRVCLQNLVWSEYWRIGVINVPIHKLLDEVPLPPVRWLTQANAYGYWADPFEIPGDPRRLICEFFDERVGVGHLEVLQVDSDAQVTDRIRLTVGGGRHVSFPNVIELDGRRLGVAEMIVRRECLLHEIDAEGIWHPLFPLLRDVAAADPALFTWEDRLWLAFTDTDLGAQDNLCLYYADQLVGPWRPHTNNPVKVDITCSRMAGGFFWHDGVLYRPAQDCLQTYGAAVVVHKIVQLTPTRFIEVPVRRLSADVKGLCPHGLHTLNAWGERTLVDGKRHGVKRLVLWRKLRQRLVRTKPDTPLPPAGQHSQKDNAMRRVFVYLPHLYTGGGEISMLRLAEGLAATGLKVDLVVHSEATRELELPPGVSLLSLNCDSTAMALWPLILLLRKHRPQWLLSAFPHTNIAAVMAVALSGLNTRCVISEHAPLSRQIAHQDNWRYRLLPPLVRWAYRRAHAVVAVSVGVRDDLRFLLGPGVTPRVINNPVLARDFELEMTLLPDDPWLLDDTLQVVLSVCRLSVEKDLPTLIRAFAEVHRERPATRLVLVGEGPDRARLESLVEKMGLTNVVRLPGRTATPLAWMRHASVFVLASQYEGFGNVLVEAMACGTPVVSTDCPVGPREVLDGGRLGMLVPVGDARAMACAIAEALTRREPLPGAREAALRYTQASACASYLDLLESLYESDAQC